MHTSRSRTGEALWLFVCLSIVCVTLLAASACRQSLAVSAPTIEFTTVPEASEGGPEKMSAIAGRATGVQAGQRIVLYAKSDVWWVQPLANKPFTNVEADSTWRTKTHLGMEYAALLVEPGYEPPLKSAALPKVGGPVVAIATVPGVGADKLAAALRAVPTTLRFSGYEWEARHRPSNRGGRPNSYDPRNAFVDANGFLHLRISGHPGAWNCAEVMMTRSLGYGTYHFVVRDTSHLEPAAVVTLYTWNETNPDQNHREVAIELSRWGQADPNGKNAQYVIQPYYVPANVARFAAPAGPLTYSMRWLPGTVNFNTVRGVDPTARPRQVSEHVFTSGVPTPGGETVHMSLYVFQQSTAPLQNETEVVIEKFEYLP